MSHSIQQNMKETKETMNAMNISFSIVIFKSL